MTLVNVVYCCVCVSGWIHTVYGESNLSENAKLAVYVVFKLNKHHVGGVSLRVNLCLGEMSAVLHVSSLTLHNIVTVSIFSIGSLFI